jgi:hypothetical protein
MFRCSRVVMANGRDSAVGYADIYRLSIEKTHVSEEHHDLGITC